MRRELVPIFLAYLFIASTCIHLHPHHHEAQSELDALKAQQAQL